MRQQFFNHRFETLRPFLDAYPVKAKIAIDPFAGEGHLLRLTDKPTLSIDIDPNVQPDIVADSFASIPKHDDAVIITNPPFCGRNILQKANPQLHQTVIAAGYSDLYEYALRRVIDQTWPGTN